MSTELLESIRRQTEALTPREKSELAAYLVEQAQREQSIQGCPRNEAMRGDAINEERSVATAEFKRQGQMAWLKANGEAFGGQYVALVGDRLIGTGRTFVETMTAARAAGEPGAFITYLPKPDEVIEAGGWL